MKEKVSFIFGTRPEAIKLAPVINLFKNQSEFNTEICFTGQHKEMVEHILPVFDILPDISLDLMTHGQTLAYFTGRAIQTLDKYIEKSKPDHIFVQGDTASVLAGALVGFFRGVKVHHVEAGLRTGEKLSPFPEEINRILTGRLADYHYPPTDKAKENLLDEGVDPTNLVVTGNTSIDSLLYVKNRLDSNIIRPSFSTRLQKVIENYKSKLILVTAHRRESFGEGFVNLCKAIFEIAKKFPDYIVVYPVHLNPNVQEPVNKYLANISNVLLCDPLDYVSFISIMDASTIILTDSGGVQEESPSLNKPILVLRNHTERPEGVEVGCAKLVGTSTSRIVREVTLLLESEKDYNNMIRNDNPYGDGTASLKILGFFKNVCLQK